ncbi:hypothetical protein [Hanstruepera marina]|uniref:hypothetical protein n=1 Tax=Hanstruepera marina TaxID=2873265 RepID=UPI001CA67F19|nr:hypothetical protein [Hanstruepera marina]
MKKLNLSSAVLAFITLFSCNTEELQLNDLETSKTPDFRVQEFNNQSQRNPLYDTCIYVQLIAGQQYEAGQVTVDIEGDDLILKYSTHEDWVINATHLSIGNCGEQDIPTTGSGNPTIGRFEHGTTHSEGVNEVVYYVNRQALNDVYCFAAHAVVTGPNGEETAWAEGLDFGGNSWAMYVEATQSECYFSDEK